MKDEATGLAAGLLALCCWWSLRWLPSRWLAWNRGLSLLSWRILRRWICLRCRSRGLRTAWRGVGWGRALGHVLGPKSYAQQN